MEKLGVNMGGASVSNVRLSWNILELENVLLKNK